MARDSPDRQDLRDHRRGRQSVPHRAQHGSQTCLLQGQSRLLHGRHGRHARRRRLSEKDAITMIPTIGELTGADEFFNHQIANTHAVVGTPERGWTEKAWMTLMRKDAQLQVTLGVGKYPNRNLIDGFAGVQRGVQQRTVRASRILAPRRDAVVIGPLDYEVVEPLRRVRLTLAENAAQPIRFELTFMATMPAFFEKRDTVIHTGRT